ncbi:transcript variant X3 [Nothobranchius furzeri]|uniref:Transcript variant X3 n=1 Tax=Nothobranchius furzeri TaxID=105023 RepID=A0A9D2YBK9_NOTFU|nr:transcript variant X3 [Nothobranchius furzeri]
MEHQKEALRRIISTLASKNEELHHFLESVDNTVAGLQSPVGICSDSFWREGMLFCPVRSCWSSQIKHCPLPTKKNFSRYDIRLQKIPGSPEIDTSRCAVRDNAITVAWQPIGETAEDGGPIERYELEYRKTNCDNPLRVTGACWEKICDIRNTEVTISGLKFDTLFVVVRVRARNKAAAGEFSEPVAMETRAFNFGFDAATAHAELKVQGDTITWEPQGVKGHEARLRSKDNKSSRGSTPSPHKTAESRVRRERFAGESYTVLGDQDMNKGCYYWELRPLDDWKSLSVGVAYRGNLGRFDQLGKSAGSWCLFASQWLQSSLAAKHNNRAKALDWQLPRRIGIYCDYDHGDLLFVDVDRLCLLHSFKTKFVQPLVPAFTVWCGSITIATGLQVPSFMGTFLETHRTPSQ